MAIPVALDVTPPPGQQPVPPTGIAPRGRWRGRWLARLAGPVALTLAALGPLLAWGAYEGSRARALQRRQAEVDALAAERAQGVREQVVAHVEVLHALRGLYEASEAVTPWEFATFTQGLWGRHPAAQAVAWAPRVVGDGSRGEAYEVRLVEPESARASWLGSEPARHPAVRAAIERAVGSAEAVLSDAHALHGGAGAALGAVLALAVPAGPSSGPGGVLLLELDGAALLRGASDSTAPERVGSLAVALLDAEAQGRRAALHVDEDAARSQDAEPTAEVAIHVAGQDWRLLAGATAGLLERVAVPSPWLVAMLVFVGWELFVGALVALGLGWRGHALARQARMTGHVLRELGDGVVVTDRHGNVRILNEAARGMLAASVQAGAGLLPFEGRLLEANGSAPLEGERLPLALALRGVSVPSQEARLRVEGEGEPPWVSVSARPLLDEHGALHGGVMVLRDVSDERRMQLRDAEMRVAGTIQQRLYPRAAPQAEGLDVAGLVSPAEETCGDYYDWVRRPDGSLLLAIGDVSGHGAGPAIVMAEVRTQIRALAAAGHEPGDILGRVNAALTEDLPDDLFVTLLLVRVDPASRAMAYANAGHPSGLLLGADGTLRAEMPATGPFLGKFPGAAYRQVETPPLAPGHVLTLLTDGVLECPDRAGERFEEERVLAVVRASRHERASGVIDRLQAALREHGRGRPSRDDVTLVVVKG